MNIENKNPDKQEQQHDANAAEADREQMSRLADELALRAGESERRYDKDHDIFTK